MTATLAIDVLTVALVSTGVFFLAVSAFGIVRFPDFFTRAHVVAKSETLGVMLVIAGVIVHHRGTEGTLRLLLLGAFAMVANATAIHALARAALGSLDGHGDHGDLADHDGVADDHGEEMPR